MAGWKARRTRSLERLRYKAAPVHGPDARAILEVEAFHEPVACCRQKKLGSAAPSSVAELLRRVDETSAAPRWAHVSLCALFGEQLSRPDDPPAIPRVRWVQHLGRNQIDPVHEPHPHGTVGMLKQQVGPAILI